jgi:Co/Zn/Cd efflux system component
LKASWQTLKTSKIVARMNGVMQNIHRIREKKEVIVPGVYEVHGVDMWQRSTFKDVTIPRWSRECKKCGLVQHTETQREVQQQKKLEPDF